MVQTSKYNNNKIIFKFAINNKDIPASSNRENCMVETSNKNKNKVILINTNFQYKKLYGSNLPLIIWVYIGVPIEKIAWFKLATKIKIR